MNARKSELIQVPAGKVRVGDRVSKLKRGPYREVMAKIRYPEETVKIHLSNDVTVRGVTKRIGYSGYLWSAGQKLWKQN